MRQNVHPFIKHIGDLRVCIVLVQHQATSAQEAHAQLGWEVRQALFILYPEEESPRDFSIAHPVSNMKLIREWVAGLNLQSILHLLSIYPRHSSMERVRNVEFNEALRQIDQYLVELDKTPSFPFGD